MASTSMHTRNDSGVSVRSFAVHDNPPSPTLTNPDMIMPIPPWQNEPSFEDDQEGPHPLLEPEVPLSQSISNSSISTASTTRGSAEELGVATAVLMPGRVTARPPTTLHGDETPIPTYMGYEHGAPLSDIYEESEATATPKSTHALRDERSPSPTPARESSTTPTRQVLRHKKRISSLSTSSSGGSDVGDWENFDTSKVLSSRVAADLAQMRREETLDVESQDMASRRQSREEEELAALNARAEKILENARKRLTHMEDNLKVARNSIIMPQRSPNLGGEHQPVGGLYRSISAAGANKLGKTRQYPQIRTSSSLQHMRGNSETGVASTTKRLSRLPDMRSASALEYGSPGRYSLFPDVNQSTPARVQPSPSSTKSFNSPLRPLEEERASPSTAETTPESVKIPPMRGLGILSSAAQTRENLANSTDKSSSRQTPTPTLMRSSSSASTRSTKDLKDQMSDLKSRMMDIRMKAQADHLRRRSMQSVRSSSPFANSQAEQWYASSPTYKEPGSPINAGAGVGWKSSSSPTLPQHTRRTSSHDRSIETGTVTPANARFLDVERMSPSTEARITSSARTDRNTPSLARRQDISEIMEEDDDEEDRSSVIHQSQENGRIGNNDTKEDDGDEAIVEQIAQNEEEQIYLNEVLEESLRDAEVEPEVPPIPASYLEGTDGAFAGAEAERHEDRLDAFDYENMFLHSAMGTYTGKSLTGSESDSDMGSDDDGSVETSRADARTPVDDLEAQEIVDTEPPTDEEMEYVMAEDDSHVQPAPKLTTDMDHRKLRSPSSLIIAQNPQPHVHARSKSMESVSTSATFETATEGERDDETPNEIYDWNPIASSSLGYSPTSYQAYRSVRNSPVNTRHGFSSPQAGGRITPRSPMVGSPLKQQGSQHFEPVIDQQRLYASPGLGIGIVGAENAQYISDDGVPQRFQGKPSPTHSRQSSTNTLQYGNRRPESSATVVAASPMKSHQRQQSSVSSAVSRVQASSPLTPAHQRHPNGSNASPVIVTVTSSPQRKVVINRALQQPESFVLSPQLSSPPNMPLPAPPASSAALQAQMASPKKVDIKGSKGHRSSPAQKRSSTTQQRAGLQSPASMIPSSPPQPVPNTEVLMESLIKLADPSFSLAPGMRFDEVDKNLVLGLLGAVGGVCNNILRAGIQNGSPELGRTQAEEMVSRLRYRLENAAEVLEGKEEERVLERERQAFGDGRISARGLRIKEI